MECKAVTEVTHNIVTVSPDTKGNTGTAEATVPSELAIYMANTEG